LHDFKATPFAENDIGGRDADVLEDEMGVAVWGIVKSEDREEAGYGDAGRIGRYEDD